ncbi:MAG: seg [Candidatus Paceibacter sp.]|jgi:hypothetical protein|nr:seg [Candidatus Paceibacter sp.]
MINLLPDNEKKLIDKEYKLRRAVLVVGACIAVVFILIMVLVPSYIMAFFRTKAVDSGMLVQDSQTEKNAAELARQIEDAKVLTKVLAPKTVSVVPSNIIPLLVSHKSDRNSITDIQFTRNTDGTAKVLVQGIAKTRESLSTFTDALSKEPTITAVDVPVSNFAKDANIEYNFTVSVKPQK